MLVRERILGYLLHERAVGAPRLIVGGFAYSCLHLSIVHHHIGAKTSNKTQKRQTARLCIGICLQSVSQLSDLPHGCRGVRIPKRLVENTQMRRVRNDGSGSAGLPDNGGTVRNQSWYACAALVVWPAGGCCPIPDLLHLRHSPNFSKGESSQDFWIFMLIWN